MNKRRPAARSSLPGALCVTMAGDRTDGTTGRPGVDVGRQSWTSYGEMFNAIVAAVSHDYAGAEACASRNVPYVGAKLSLLTSRPFHGDDAVFLRDTRRYLGMLGDPGLSVAKAGVDPLRDWSVGFRVRAAEDCLHVVEARAESGLRAGDRIVALGGAPVAAYREGARRDMLYGGEPERELWDFFLTYADAYEVERGGERLRVRPSHLSVTPHAPRNAFRPLNDGAFLARLESLADAEGIARALEAHAGELSRARLLVLDLRDCRGGAYDGIVPLVPYLADRPMTPAAFMGELGLYMRYSHQNCERLAQSLEREAALAADDPAASEACRDEAARVRSLSGSGLVWEDAEVPEAWLEEVAPAGPERVAVLSDLGCRAEGECLLAMAAGQSRVTTVGRASLGDSDYQEPLTVSFEDDILFTYPVGMTRDAHDGRGVLGRGVPVRTHVPWTPEELTRDVVLETALAAG